MQINKQGWLKNCLNSVPRQIFITVKPSKNIKAFEKPPDKNFNEYWKQKYYRVYPLTRQYIKNIFNLQKDYEKQQISLKNWRISVLASKIISYLRYFTPRHQNYLDTFIYSIGPVAMAVIQNKEPGFEAHKLNIIQALLQSKFDKLVDPQQLLKIIQFRVDYYVDSNSRLRKFRHDEVNFSILQVAKQNIIQYQSETRIKKFGSLDQNYTIKVLGKILFLISSFQQRSRQKNIVKILQYYQFFRPRTYQTLLKVHQKLQSTIKPVSDSMVFASDKEALVKVVNNNLTKQSFQLLILFNKSFNSFPQAENAIKRLSVQFVKTYIQVYIRFQQAVYQKISTALFFNRILRYFPLNFFYIDPQGREKHAKAVLFDYIVSNLNQRKYVLKYITASYFERQIFLNYILSFIFSYKLQSLKLSYLDEFAIIRTSKLTIPVIPQIIWDLYKNFQAQTYQKYKIDSIFHTFFEKKYRKLNKKKFVQASQHFRSYHKKFYSELSKFMIEQQPKAKSNQLILGFQANYVWQTQKIVLLIDEYESFTFPKFDQKQAIKYRDSVLICAGYKIVKIQPNQFYSWNYQVQQSSIQLILAVSYKLQIIRSGRALWVC